MTATTIPTTRPRLTQSELRALLAPFAIDRTTYPIVVVGVRGYYRDTMGLPGVNDRGIFDDAIFVEAAEVFAAFNGNCDPTRVRKGRGTGAAKGMASLNPGCWYAHTLGFHKQDPARPALVQTSGAVTVTRDGDPPYADTGYFGINVHDAPGAGTSSEGCQTIPRGPQYTAFITTLQDQARRHFATAWRKRVIPYVLLAPDHPLR